MEALTPKKTFKTVKPFLPLPDLRSKFDLLSMHLEAMGKVLRKVSNSRK